MKNLVDYINEDLELQELHESITTAAIVASSMMTSSGHYSSYDDDDGPATTGQNISAILRVCSFIAGGCLASLTGIAAVVAGIVLLILSVVSIPYGDFIDGVIDGAKNLKKKDVSEGFDEEIEYIDEGLLDKFKEIKNKLKEKTIKAFAKACLKNKKISNIIQDIKNQKGYEEAVKSKSFNTLAKFVGEYFKNNKQKAEEAGKDIKNDKTTLA